VAEKAPKGFFGIAGKLAERAATAMVTDEKIAATVAAKLIETIPSKTADMGITLQLTTSFQKGAYVVLKAQVTNVNTPVLLAKAKGDEFATKFAQLLDLLDYFSVSDTKAGIEKKVHGKVQEALLTKLEEVLPAKLQEANISVSVSAKPDFEQAEFFYSFLASIEAPAVSAQ